MKSSSFLRWVVVGQLLLIALSFVLEGHFARSLPPAARQLREAAVPDQPWAMMVALGVGVLIMVVVAMVALLGLLCLRRWAAWLYLGATVVLLPVYLVVGYSVEPALEQVLGDLMAIGTGLILALCFFSSALERAPAVPPPPPAPRTVP